MDYEEINAMGVSLVKEYLNGWTFKFDNAKRRFGCCHFGKKEITLSLPLSLLNDEASIRDTILHEIAHAKVGINHNHDSEWRAMAKSIGGSGNRCYKNTEVKQPHKPWVAICGICGKTYSSYKKHYGQCACRLCYSQHKEKAMLSFKYVKEEKNE